MDWYGGLAADRYPSPTLPVQVDTTLPLLEEADEPPLRKDPSGDDAPQTTSGNPGVSDKTLDGDTDDPDAYFDMTSCTLVHRKP